MVNFTWSRALKTLRESPSPLTAVITVVRTTSKDS